MSKYYFERRGTAGRGNIDLAADMMRHLHTRQYLGKAIVICAHPALLMPAAHKQWLRLSRTIQRERASTSNADKILKHTRTITHMQHLHFTTKTPLENPEADVFFLRRDQLDAIPFHSFSVYCTTALTADDIPTLLTQLPTDSLIVDYNTRMRWQDYDAAPKRELELQVSREWQAAKSFLLEHAINPTALFDGSIQNVEAMDDALDTLLGISNKFLPVANSFNHALELARPLRLSKSIRHYYDAFALLAHRVQALSTNSLSQHFLETYNEDDTFFLYDVMKHFRHTTIDLAATIASHRAAGRQHLAQALVSQALAR